MSIQVHKTKKQVRGMIGLVNFYAKYVPNVADLFSPLHDMTKKGQLKRIKGADPATVQLQDRKHKGGHE